MHIKLLVILDNFIFICVYLAMLHTL